MTEFTELGKHCQFKGCNRQDFLPFNCKYCRVWFCKNHWEVNNHQCQDYVMPNTVEKAAIRNGAKIYSNICNFPSCKIREIVPVKCENCGENHCFKHRMPQLHNCSAVRKG